MTISNYSNYVTFIYIWSRKSVLQIIYYDVNEVKFLYFKPDETDENFQFQIIYAIRDDFIDLVCIFMLLTH